MNLVENVITAIQATLDDCMILIMPGGNDAWVAFQRSKGVPAPYRIGSSYVAALPIDARAPGGRYERAAVSL